MAMSEQAALAQKIREKKRVALTSVLAALLITGLKLGVGLKTNSLGILSEAAHSGLDLVAAVMTYFAVSLADRPADSSHLYGHGKIENVSALFETLLLMLTCGWIIREAINRLATGESLVQASIWGYGVIVFAILVDIGRSRALGKMAKKHHSQALEADALHFSSDVASSLVVLAGLVFVSLGYHWVDSVAALAVAILVLAVCWRLGRRTVDALMDRAPDGLRAEIRSAIAAVAGVREVLRVRLRQSGSMIFVDTTITIDQALPFEQAHAIADEVEHAVRAVRPAADVVVHAEPAVAD